MVIATGSRKANGVRSGAKKASWNSAPAVARPPCTVPAGIHSPCPSETVKIRSATREVSVPPRTQTSSWRGCACGDHSVGTRGTWNSERIAKGACSGRAKARRTSVPSSRRHIPGLASAGDGPTMRPSLSAPVPGPGPWPATTFGKAEAEDGRPWRRGR